MVEIMVAWWPLDAWFARWIEWCHLLIITEACKDKNKKMLKLRRKLSSEKPKKLVEN